MDVESTADPGTAVATLVAEPAVTRNALPLGRDLMRVLPDREFVLTSGLSMSDGSSVSDRVFCRCWPFLKELICRLLFSEPVFTVDP